MTHPEQEMLAAVALDEQVEDAVRRHLESCQSCRAEVARLREVFVVAGSLGQAPVRPVRPPDGVWTSVLSEIHGPPPARLAAAVALPPTTEGRRPARGLVIGAVGVAVGIAATLAVVAMAGRDTPAPPPGPAPAAIAQASLQPLQDPTAPHDTTRGTARVTRDGTTRVVHVRLSGPAPTADGFVQAWLLDPSNQHMVALGVVDGRTGDFAVPSGLDLDSYRAVDISLEPYDGNPAHSAVSLARGSFRP